MLFAVKKDDPQTSKTEMRQPAKVNRNRQLKIVNLFASQPFFGELEGAEDGAGFVLAFVVLAGGDGVCDDAGAGLRVGNFIFD